MNASHTRTRPRLSGARIAAVAICLALAFAGAHTLAGGAAPAHASEVHYCEIRNLPPGGECRDTVFRWVTRTWGRSDNGNTVCASAVNSNGILVGGLVCAGSRTFISNGNYDGTKLLHALIYNAGNWDVFYGLVNYNP
jgi:hypothetical protein